MKVLDPIRDRSLIGLLSSLKQHFNKPLLKGHLIYNSKNTLGKIYVFENSEYRWLCFDKNAIQTQIFKKKPWQPAMQFIKPLTLLIKLKPVEDVLILGGGAGSLYHYLQHQCPQTTLTFIEYNPEVLRVGKYFFFLPDDYAELHEAKSFISEGTKRYGHIIVDLYSSHISPLYQDLAFLEQLKKRSQHGISFNILCSADKMKQTIAMLRTVFGQNTLVLFIPKSTNVILHVLLEQPVSHVIHQLNKKGLIGHCHWDAVLGFYAKSQLGPLLFL